ncbi:MAG: hypothetical protein ACXQTI_06640 [Candidatus Nezhaarchaeales archaeon]
MAAECPFCNGSTALVKAKEYDTCRITLCYCFKCRVYLLATEYNSSSLRPLRRTISPINGKRAYRLMRAW